MKGEYAPSTREKIKSTINYFEEWCRKGAQNPETLTYNQLLEYVRHLKEQGNKPITLQLKLGHLKGYYDQLVKEKIREDNPVSYIETRGVRGRQLYQILEPEALNNIYENYPVKETGTVREKVSLASKRDKVLVGFLVYQGVTTREAINLKLDDLDLKKGRVEIRAGRRTNRRTIELKPVQILELINYLKETREEILSYKNEETDYLFITAENGKQATFKTRIAYIMRTLRKHNRTFKNANQLRTSVITYWLKIKNLREVQYLAGHRYVSSTEKYLVNDLEQLIESVEKYHPLG